jgi:formate-dependent nitrite reductase membrane component NrfD
MPPSDTFFTADPHWSWLVILYFFLGGLAGGSYFIAAMLDLFGDERDRPLARIGYYVAFPLVLICGLLLVLDLNRPEAFWHMLIQSRRVPLPMLKYWSPMSAGSWALLIFGAFSFASFLGSLTEEGVIRWGAAKRLDQFVRRGRIGGVFALVGSVVGFFLAGYTGVLASVSNRPLWADTNMLGLLFLASAGSTAAALLILLSRWRNISRPSLDWLQQMDLGAMLVELAALVLVVVTLGPVAVLWLSLWGVLLVVGVVLLGILRPLLLYLRSGTGAHPLANIAAVLVLAGGFLLRVVIVMSS